MVSSDGTTVETVTAETMGSVATGAVSCALQSNSMQSKAQMALHGLMVPITQVLRAMRSRKIQEM